MADVVLFDRVSIPPSCCVWRGGDALPCLGGFLLLANGGESAELSHQFEHVALVWPQMLMKLMRHQLPQQQERP